MRTAWSAISFLAVVHLLAVTMFIGWLWQSGRLDRGRIEMLRETFALTVDEAARLAAEAEQRAEEERRQAMEDYRRDHPPLPSVAQIRQISQIEEIENRAMRRLRDERSALAAQLDEAMARIAARERAFEAERIQWLNAIEADRARRTDEQFAKTVRQYESVPARQAKSMLMELIEQGRTEQAVAYLDAMNARAAAKVLQEFRAEHEIALATELLEQLRRLGLPDPSTSPQDSAYADGHPFADARR